jgi:hypothetical protein
MDSSGSSSTNRPADDSASPAQRLDALRSRWQTLSGKVTLDETASSLTETASDVAGLADDILAARRRGYVFHKEWEARATALKKAWPEAQAQAQRAFDAKRRTLSNMARQTGQMVNRAAGNNAMLSSLEGNLDLLEKEIDAAGKAILSQVGAINQGISDIHWDLERVDYMLGVVESGVVKLLPDEYGVAACPANMMVGRKEKDEGVLLLTDRRLIFIHEEEKVLKKVLFFATEKETVRALRWAAPIGAVDKLDAEDKGGFLGFGEKEMLTIDFDDRAKDLPKKAVMHLIEGTENEEWRTLIMQVKTGDIEKERVKSAGKESAQPTAPMPTECPNCGAKLPPVYKGMVRIECEFCDAVVAIP